MEIGKEDELVCVKRDWNLVNREDSRESASLSSRAQRVPFESDIVRMRLH